MHRIMLPIASALAACAPSPQDVAMPAPTQPSRPSTQAAAMAQPVHRGDTPASSPMAHDPAHAAQGPSPLPVSAAENLLRPPASEPAIAAQGRRTLSTAFVRIGPDGHLTVTLHNGTVVTLRDVTMGPKEYCGSQVAGGSTAKRFCGAYVEVAAARPGI